MFGTEIEEEFGLADLGSSSDRAIAATPARAGGRPAAWLGRPRARGALAVALALAAATGGAEPVLAQSLPTRISEAMAAARDKLLGGSNVMQRYGNWVGPGWWGGSEMDSHPGMLAPVDDLDAVAQKHDFGYQVAEELGRGRPGVEASYKLLADIIAIRETKALDSDPGRWAHPPKDVALARTFTNRLIISFEEWQTRYNRFKSMEPGRDDITDLDTLDRVLDGLPDAAKFEALQKQRIAQWQQQYAAFQKWKQQNQPQPPPPTTTSSGSNADCNQGSFMDRTLCAHKVTPNTKPSSR